MNNIFVGLIIAVIAGWFGYCLYRMWRGARGADCASCALGGDFDYGTYGREAVPEKPMEVVTSAGHHIIREVVSPRLIFLFLFMILTSFLLFSTEESDGRLTYYFVKYHKHRRQYQDYNNHTDNRASREQSANRTDHFNL